MIVLLLSQTAFEEMGAASSIFKYVRYLCYFLAALLILQDSYREKQIWGVAILGVLTVGTVVCSGNSTFILYLIMILAAKEVNVRTIVKLTCIIQGAMLLSIVVMSQIGIIPDYIFDASTRQRHGLGFLWTTTGAILYFYFMVLYIYLREERAHLIEYVILEAVNFGLYKLTDARMSFYLSTLLLVYVYVMRFYWQNRKNRIRKNRLLIGAPAFFCILAVACQIFYIPTDARWQKINSVLSGRLELGCFGWRDYGFSLLGTKIEWIGFSHNATAGKRSDPACHYHSCIYVYHVYGRKGKRFLSADGSASDHCIFYNRASSAESCIQSAAVFRHHLYQPAWQKCAVPPGRPPSEPACAVSYHTCEAEGKKVTTMNEYRNNENE